jgi:hypothetical protein
MRRLMSSGFVIVATTVAAILAAGPAGAICLQPQPVRVCTEFFRSENVVVAKVLSKRRIPDTPDPNNVEGWFYKVEIAKSFRGDAFPDGEIYTGNDETKFPMEVGHSYLLFVNRNQQGRAAPDMCGNSAELSKAGDALAALDAIAKAAKSGGGGEIGGRVMLPVAGSQAMSDSGAPGITLTIQNYVGRDTEIVTDKEGRFNAHVPAGHYSVTGKSDAWDVVPYALSYMKPTDFEIPDGSCADLMFLAQPK